MTAKDDDRAAEQVISGQGSARARETSAFRLEPHCCRVCFGRVASTATEHGRLFVCTNCGLSATGSKPDVICSCGLKIRKSKGDGRSGQVMVDAGVRCHPNKRVSPEFPALYVASFGGAQAEGQP